MTTSTRTKFGTMDDVRRANAAIGHHWFEPESLRFFDSKVGRVLYGGRYFVTSEQFHAMDGTSARRAYTVRVARPSGEIDTVGEFQAYASGDAAKRAVARLVAADELARDVLMLVRAGCAPCVRRPDGVVFAMSIVGGQVTATATDLGSFSGGVPLAVCEPGGAFLAEWLLGAKLEDPSAEVFRREVRALYGGWMEHTDEDGVIDGSAADLLSDVFEMLQRLGMVIR